MVSHLQCLALLNQGKAIPSAPDCGTARLRLGLYCFPSLDLTTPTTSRRPLSRPGCKRLCENDRRYLDPAGYSYASVCDLHPLHSGTFPLRLGRHFPFSLLHLSFVGGASCIRRQTVVSISTAGGSVYIKTLPIVVAAVKRTLEKSFCRVARKIKLLFLHISFTSLTWCLVRAVDEFSISCGYLWRGAATWNRAMRRLGTATRAAIRLDGPLVVDLNKHNLCWPRKADGWLLKSGAGMKTKKPPMLSRRRLFRMAQDPGLEPGTQ